MPARPPNATLAALLRDVGWSPYELARAVNRALDGSRRIHPTTPFTWRDRGVVPRDPLPSVIAGVLSEAHGRLVTEQELWPDRPATPGRFTAATDGLDGIWSPPEGLHLLGQARSRRPSQLFFALAGPGLIGTAQEWTRPNPQLLAASRHGSGEVTPELIDYLDADIASLRRLDDGHGGLLVMRAAGHQLALAIDLLRDSRYGRSDGRRLASVVGQLAQLTGWLNFDLGDHGEAQRLYLLGLRAASLAGDRELGALLLSSLAFQQSWRNRPADAIALLRIATIGMSADPSPRTQALLAMREARAHAAAGDERRCRAAIDRAHRGLDRASGEPSPPWAYWLDSTVLTSETGRCLLHLGQLEPAREHLNRGIGMLGDEPSRDRILYGLSFAHALNDTAHPSRADLELACHEAGQVLPMMTTVSSARCRRLLDVVIAGLRPHRTAAVRALLDRAEAHRGAEL